MQFVRNPTRPLLRAVVFACAPLAAAQAQSASWSVESNQAQARFGCALASAGDVDGSGTADVLVGAADFDGAAAGSGAAFLYRTWPLNGPGPGPDWSVLGFDAQGEFGASLAGVGDVDGDGFDDVLVGAPGWNGGAGRAYLFLGSASGLATTPARVLEHGQAGERFGASVAGAGDVNGDGFDDVLIGAPLCDSGSPDEGAAFLYLGSASGLAASWSWMGEANRAQARYGSALAGAGDVDRDGFDDVLVGAPGWSNGQSEEGAAFLHRGSAGGLLAAAAWSRESDQAGAQLGNALAGAGDFDGDGYADVLVAAHLFDGSAPDQGRVELFRGSAGGLSNTPAWTATGAQGSDFGCSVASAGFVNDDAFADLVIGARRHDTTQIDAGAAFVYFGSPGASSGPPDVVYAGDQAGAELGSAVSSAGDVQLDGAGDVLVGAPLYDGGEANEGALSGFWGEPTWCSTHYVDVNATPPYWGTAARPFARIQDAIAHPTTGESDTVLVAPGTYFENLDFLRKPIRVQGSAGAAATIVDASGAGSVVKFGGAGASATLAGFTLQHGSGTLYAGKLCGGGVFFLDLIGNVEDCRIVDNAADAGGGVYVRSASPGLYGCEIANNTATEGGGVACEFGPGINIEQCSIHDNVAGDGGGVLLRSHPASFSFGSIDSNRADGKPLASAAYGAGLAAFDCDPVYLGDVHVGSNELQLGDGVGLYFDASVVTIERSTVTGNVTTWCSSGRGGGVYASCDSTLAISDSELSFNTSVEEGGGLWGAATLQRCAVRDNLAQFGAGVFDACNGVQAQACSFLHNSALGCSGEGGGGGGAHGGTYTNCEFVGNIAYYTDCLMLDGDGGGATNATLDQCSLEGNRAGKGGGADDCVLTGCAVLDNQAYFAGGGAYGGTASDCVVRGNDALGLTCSGQPPVEGRGGGLAHVFAERCQVFDNRAERGGGAALGCVLGTCTVAGNVATVEGGGVFEDGQWTTLRDSIVYGNVPDPLALLSGSISAIYSDIEGGYPGPGNIAADPRFWDAPEFDFHLKPGSPCIDSGDPSSPLDPDGSRADMGALPFDPSWCALPSGYCTAKTNSQGCTAAMGFSGTLSLSGPDDFFVAGVEILNGQNGVLIWSRRAVAVPFQGGTRCVGVPLVRSPLQNSGGNPPPDDCSGTFSFHFSQAYLAQFGLAAGDTLYAQWWYRDPASPPFFTGLSNALRLHVCP